MREKYSHIQTIPVYEITTDEARTEWIKCRDFEQFLDRNGYKVNKDSKDSIHSLMESQGEVHLMYSSIRILKGV